MQHTQIRNQRNHPYNKQRKVYQVYSLFFLSIFLYLFGAYNFVPNEYSLLMFVILFVTFFWVVICQSNISLYVFSFSMGISHHPFFKYVSIIDSEIISIALCLTTLLFMGLTLIALYTTEYSMFVWYGTIYSFFSGIIWLTLLNLFFKNSLFDLVLIYASTVSFSLFVIIDTQNIINDTENKTAVYYAMQLLLNFVGLLIDIIRLLKHLKNTKKNN